MTGSLFVGDGWISLPWDWWLPDVGERWTCFSHCFSLLASYFRSMSHFFGWGGTLGSWPTETVRAGFTVFSEVVSGLVRIARAVGNVMSSVVQERQCGEWNGFLQPVLWRSFCLTKLWSLTQTPRGPIQVPQMNDWRSVKCRWEGDRTAMHWAVQGSPKRCSRENVFLHPCFCFIQSTQKYALLTGHLQKNIYKACMWILKHANKMITYKPTAELNISCRYLIYMLFGAWQMYKEAVQKYS